MFTRDIGVDLGTANTLVCVKGKGITYLDVSIESHLMALAAEKSRRTGEVCYIKHK